MKNIRDLIKLEEKRQQNSLMMIPSENYTYPEVRDAVGSVLMHKYAEGYSGRRYYQGNEFADEVERLCIENTYKAFGLNKNKYHVNVQPHSGSPANLAVYNSVLKPGDKILSMHLTDGGHLSHGWSVPGKNVTLVSKIYDIYFYKVDPKTKVFDYQEIEKTAYKVKPKLLISGGTAYPREIDYKKMSEISRKVGAYYLADVAHEAGLIAGGVNKSPFKYADFVTFTTHKTLRGPRGAVIVCKNKYGKDLDASLFPGMQGGPHLHSIAGIAIALEKANSKQFKKYAAQVVKNAKLLSKLLVKSGLDVVSGGTDKHLVLIDLRNVGANGWTIAWALDGVGIIANKNTVPGETSSPYYPSGLRLGTPAITVRGMKEKEMEQISGVIASVIDRFKGIEIPKEKEKRLIFNKKFKKDLKNDNFLKKKRKIIDNICKKFPIEF